MNNYEILSILVSIISAGVALRAIIVSLKTAEEQRNIAHRIQLLESKNSTAIHHGKYNDLLFSVQNETKQCKDKLSEAAYASLQKVLRLCDKFGAVQSDSVKPQRHTRHVFHEACERLYQAFNPHLSCRSGINLRMRYNQLRYIDINPLSDGEIKQLEMDVDDIKLEKAGRENTNEELEHKVVASYRFRNLIQELLTRISIEDRPLVFQEALQELVQFFTIYEQSIGQLSSAQKILENGLAQNELEEFSLIESPLLYQPYKREIAKLEVLQNLDVTGIGCLADMRVNHSIPELLHIGCVLYTISMYWDWGNSRQTFIYH